MILQIKTVVARITRRILERLGWGDCPVCHSFIRPRWVKDCALFEDEPPMFCHWECPRCHARTPVVPTFITLSVMKKHNITIDDIISKGKQQ